MWSTISPFRWDATPAQTATAGPSSREAADGLEAARDRFEGLQRAVERERELVAAYSQKEKVASARATKGIRLVSAAAPFALGAMVSGSLGGPVGTILGIGSLACTVALAGIGMPMSAIYDMKSRGYKDALAVAQQRLANTESQLPPARAELEAAQKTSAEAAARELEAMATGAPLPGEVQNGEREVVVNGIRIQKREAENR